MMEISRLSQPFPAGPDSISVGLVGYFDVPENTHLPGYNLNNEPFPIRDTFAHRPDPLAYDYYPNLNAVHERRQEESLREFNANYLSFFDRTPEPVCIDPPLTVVYSEPIELPTAEPMIFADMSDFRQPRDYSIIAIPTFTFEPVEPTNVPSLPIHSPEQKTFFDFAHSEPLPVSSSKFIFEEPTNLASPPFLHEAQLLPAFNASNPWPDTFQAPAIEPHNYFKPTYPSLDIAPTFVFDDPLKPLPPLRSDTQHLLDLSPKLGCDTPLMPNVEPVSLAPIVGRSDSEVVYKGYGNSHFSHVDGIGWHATTQIAGIGKKEGFDTEIKTDPTTDKKLGFRGFSLHDPI